MTRLLVAMALLAPLFANPKLVQSAWTETGHLKTVTLPAITTTPGSLLLCLTPSPAVVIGSTGVFRSAGMTHYYYSKGKDMMVITAAFKDPGEYSRVVCSEYTGIQIDGLGKPQLFIPKSEIIRPIPFTEIWRRFWSDR